MIEMPESLLGASTRLKNAAAAVAKGGRPVTLCELFLCLDAHAGRVTISEAAVLGIPMGHWTGWGFRGPLHPVERIVERDWRRAWRQWDDVDG